MAGRSCHLAKVKRNYCMLGWTANMLLAILACWRVDWRMLSFFQPSYSSFQRLNWYVLDTLSHDSQILYDDWSSSSARERLLPGLGPLTVHYFRCDQKPFNFNSYLSVLSVFKVIKPDRIILHMTERPSSAHHRNSTLLDELMYTIPILSLQQLPQNHLCSEDAHTFKALVLSTVLVEGGIFCDWNTIITEFSPFLLNRTLVKWSTLKNKPNKILRADGGMLFSKGNTGMKINRHNYKSVMNREEQDGQCGSPHQYNLTPKKYRCVLLNRPIKFENIHKAKGHFPELVRWLASGKKEVPLPLRSDRNKIPLLAHIVRRRQGELELSEYHSILSAVKVGFLVKFYSFSEPWGLYWESVIGSGQVQFASMDQYDFGSKTTELNRTGDILCVDLVLREGGVCQTTNTLWRFTLPTSLREYDFVVSQQNGRPDVSVLMGKRHARFLKVLLPKLRLYEGNNWHKETIHTAYRAIQQFPDLVYTNSQLSVTCGTRQCLDKLLCNKPYRGELYVNILPSAEKWFIASESRDDQSSLNLCQT